MAEKMNHYKALATFLDPKNPAVGADQLDEVILAMQRARWRPWNRSRATFWMGNVLFALAVADFVLRACNWLDPRFAATPLASLATIMPIWGAVLMIAAAACLLAMSWRFEKVAEARRPIPPSSVRAWLLSHGKSDFLYWHEIYWTYAKIQAHRREFLGFVLWRKALLPVERYAPAVPRVQRVSTLPDPHWAYLQSAEGQADSAAYLVDFEQRLDAWDRVSFRASLVLLAGLLVVTCLPVYPPTQSGHLMRTGVMLALIVKSFLLFFGRGTVKMRWLPAAFRRYWFRGLPPEAARFRDHMLAITD